MSADALHDLGLGDVLREHARSHPQKLASVYCDRRTTFQELDERVSRLANALRDRGFRAGDRALWLAQNSDRWLEVLLAVAKLGGHFVPVNWRLSVEELVFVIEDAEPTVVFWQQEEIGSNVAATFERAALCELRVQVDAEPDDPYEALLQAGAPDDPVLAVDPGRPLLHMYTAGFGGTPNGALLSHRAIVAQNLVFAWLDQKSSDDVYLAAGPLFHMGTFMFSMSVFQCAGTLVFARRVVAAELCRLIEDERCTGAFVVGPTVEEIVELNRAGRYDLSSLRTLPMGSSAWSEMTTPARSPYGLHPNGYGQTELMGMTTFLALGATAAGISGRPSPMVQIRILDAEGDEVPTGEVGEICVRGPTVMNGYWRRPEMNAERQRGGWHRTHDLGRREADGSISFIGPLTRLIKSAAENIYPAEVERCIVAHPAVAACGVIGVPDPKWVQSVKAIVVLAEGQTAGAEDIIEHCRSRIAGYKKPRLVEFAGELPRQGYAIDYEALDARYGGGNYPGERYSQLLSDTAPPKEHNMNDELSGFRFVSADSHVNEPPEMFRERMPKAMQDRAPRLEDVDGVPHLLVEGLRPRRMPKGREKLSEEEVDRAQAGGWDPQLRLRDQERDGVAAEVVFPTLSLQSTFSSPDPALQFALARAYNDWVAEVFGEYPERFAPAGLVPMLDLEAAEKEARHCMDLGLRSLFLPIQVPERPYNDSVYDTFWAFAQEAGVPVTFHSGTGHEPRVVRGPGGAIINYLLGAQADGAHLVMHLTASGVLDRFPELTVVTVETGAAWLAWVMTQMDEIADKHHMWAKPKLSMKPSEFVRRQVHVTFQNDPVGVHNRVFTGVESLLWGSDYPHPEGTWPHSQKVCAEQLAGLQDAEKRAILGETTARLFGF